MRYKVSIDYEADPHHAGILVGLRPNKFVSFVTDSVDDNHRELSEDMDASEAEKYEGAVARYISLVTDRLDSQFASRAVIRHLAFLEKKCLEWCS